MKTSLKYLLLAVIFLVIGIFIGKLIFSSGGSCKKTKTNKVDEKKAVNISDSLLVEGGTGSVRYSDYKKSYETDLDGKIKSRAVKTSYKDFVLELKFYSKTGTLLGKDEYTLYEYVRPMKEFEITHYIYDIIPPDNSYKIKWILKNAEIKTN